MEQEAVDYNAFQCRHGSWFLLVSILMAWLFHSSCESSCFHLFLWMKWDLPRHQRTEDGPPPTHPLFPLHVSLFIMIKYTPDKTPFPFPSWTLVSTFGSESNVQPNTNENNCNKIHTIIHTLHLSNHFVSSTLHLSW